MMEFSKTAVLFAITALAELVGCYLTYMCLRQGKPVWVLLPAALSLAAFAWLLTLHPFAAGRTYAAYGGVYVAAALGWLWLVDRVVPTRWDALGVAVTLLGMAMIVLQPQRM